MPRSPLPGNPMKSGRVCLSLALSLLVARAALGQDTPQRSLDAIFAAKDDKTRDKLISALAGRELTDHAAAREHALGLQRRVPAALPELKIAHEGALDYPYQVRTRRTVYNNYAMVDLPKGLSRDKPVPLVIGLHSEKGTAWYELSGLRACLRTGAGGLGDCILACPQALNRGLTSHDPTTNPPGITEYFGWGPKQEGVDTVLNLIDGLVRDYNIDRDRIYLTGGGMGGEACFRLAQLRPCQFAAICVRDALPMHYLTELKPNDGKQIADLRAAGKLGEQPVEFPWLLAHRNMPVTWVHANDDKKYPTAWARKARDAMQQAKLPLQFHEYEGFHGSAKVELIAQALGEMLQHRREPSPAELTARGMKGDDNPGNNRHGWLEIKQQTWQGKRGDWPEKQAAGGLVTVSTSKAENLITVTSEGVSELVLWLHDGLIDLSKPIRLVVNGKEREPVTLKRDQGVLAQTAWDMRQTGEAYTAKLAVRP
ncbi:MAG: hypothetical protein HS108_03800 [Planctomycetes bacterium]|nr:hypothetical protein [Planctomycetota bacterium]